MMQSPLRMDLWALGALFVIGASAQQVTLKLTDPNPQAFAVYGNGGGVYTSPYTFSVTSGGVTSTGILLSCDDFKDDVFLNESWTANETSLQNNILGEQTPNTTVYFDQGSVTSQENQYSEVAYLAGELMQQGSVNGYGNQTAAEYSFAIWSIFDPSGVANFMAGGVTNGSQVLKNFANDVNADVAAAISFVTQGGIVANETIYTPVAGSQVPNTDPQPQEFIQVTGANQFASTPEPSSVAALVIDLAFVVGLLCVVRRRIGLNN